MSEWGERIARRMRETGVNQTELAAACGIRPPSVNGWVSGETKMIDGQNLVLAAAKLNTSPEWVMTGRGVAERIPASQPAQLDPGKIATVAKALRIILQRRDPGATLDLEDPIDAELFAMTYAELLNMDPADGIAAGAVVADLMAERERRRNAGGNSGGGSQQAGGADGGKTRKARPGR